jgi:hypothetical protein
MIISHPFLLILVKWATYTGQVYWSSLFKDLTSWSTLILTWISTLFSHIQKRTLAKFANFARLFLGVFLNILQCYSFELWWQISLFFLVRSVAVWLSARGPEHQRKCLRASHLPLLQKMRICLPDMCTKIRIPSVHTTGRVQQRSFTMYHQLHNQERWWWTGQLWTTWLQWNTWC